MNAQPQDGESVEDYGSRLRYDGGLAMEFIRTTTGAWFVRGGFDCIGGELHQWHNGCDDVYAAGSQIVAGNEVSLALLSDAVDTLEAAASASTNAYDREHAGALLDLMKAALQAEPSEELQYVGA